ncbi:hypothetical protein [Novosphingobium sp. Rr 2-17]|uniref:hypothetical protein n=1 Tax=Novosphingobium sp. Rr 2-17 TaxID=555793 RepID=UPI001ED9824B|nr:hypothetical protein [Novosphingobium sp. Rr 2-17]
MRIVRGYAGLAPMALALSMGFTAAPALADDPLDATMTPEALARDREQIRRLNADQLAYVQQRDTQYAQGWREYAGASRADAGRADARQNDTRAPAASSSQRDYAQAQREYAAAQREYQRDLAQWREDVAACRAGYYEHCAR